MFEPLQQEPAYRRIASAIEEKIMARALQAGDPLPGEVHLARQFAVNRSTVREALRELESKGLIERRPGGKRRRVVHPRTADVATGVSRALALRGVTFFEVWEAMMVLEPEIAALAARRRSAEELARLTHLAERLRAAGADSKSAVAAVVEFFRALARSSHNRVLALAQAPLTRLLAPSLGGMIDRVPQARVRIAAAQRRLIEAIQARNVAEARTWMEKHIRDFRRGYELAGIAADASVGSKSQSAITAPMDPPGSPMA